LGRDAHILVFLLSEANVMSNCVYVTVYDATIHGTGIKMVGMVVHDSYGQVSDFGYDSYEEFLERYPTRQSIIEWIGQQPGFDDDYYNIAGEEPVYVSGFPVRFEGYNN
jgi:hypothetical protein